MTNPHPTATLNVIAPRDFAGRPRSLAQAVQAAVRTVDEVTLRPVTRRDAGLAFQPKALLALLSYCTSVNSATTRFPTSGLFAAFAAITAT